MIEKTREIKVTNRDSGAIGYVIPDLNNLYRRFSAGETKTLTFEELEKLSWIQGGKRILQNYLKIDDEEVVKALLGDVEPEYYYSEDEVKALLSPAGTLEQLEDCLRYAPDGVLELIKKTAVETKLNDLAKREAIKKALKFDVSAAIMINEASAEEEVVEPKTTKRKAEPIKVTKGERKAPTVTIKK